MAERYGLRRRGIWAHITRQADSLVLEHLQRVEFVAEAPVRETQLSASRIVEVLTRDAASPGTQS